MSNKILVWLYKQLTGIFLFQWKINRCTEVAMYLRLVPTGIRITNYLFQYGPQSESLALSFFEGKSFCSFHCIRNRLLLFKAFKKSFQNVELNRENYSFGNSFFQNTLLIQIVTNSNVIFQLIFLVPYLTILKKGWVTIFEFPVYHNITNTVKRKTGLFAKSIHCFQMC